MKNNPKVSVIIPVYNVETYLTDCLDSVLSQTLRETEIICINDGSADRSLDILKEYEEKDSRIKVLSQSNKGQGSARNLGIKAAHGEYICFVDSDDIILSDFLKKLYDESIRSQLNILSCEIKVEYENESLRKITEEDYYNKKGVYNYVTNGKKLFSDMIDNNDFCVSANILFINRKWILDEEIIFPEGVYFEDAVFCLKCYIYAKRIKQIPYKGYIYRVRHASTMTSVVDSKRVISWLEVFRHELILLLDEQDVLFQKALSKYIRMWYYYIRRITSKSNLISEIELPPILALLRFLLGLEKRNDIEGELYEEKLLILGFERMILKSNGVILYGAGEVGQYVLRYLISRNLYDFVKYFAVSEITSGLENIKGVPVCDIEKLAGSEYLVILCVGDKYREDMKKKLIGVGIKRYFILNKRLRKMIKSSI